MAKLSNNDVINIRASNESNKVLACRYNVSIKTISAIRNFRKRKNG